MNIYKVIMNMMHVTNPWMANKPWLYFAENNCYLPPLGGRPSVFVAPSQASAVCSTVEQQLCLHVDFTKPRVSTEVSSMW